MQNSTSMQIIKNLLMFSILLNIFLFIFLPSYNDIKILQKINYIKEYGKKYIDPTVPFKFRAVVGGVDREKECIRDGSAKLMQATIDYERKFVYLTYRCKKANFIQELNVALSLYHDNFNVYTDSKNSDLNISIGEVAPIDRRDMGI